MPTQSNSPIRLVTTPQGVTVPVIDTGTGHPVVFLHGAPAHKEEWSAVIDWLKDKCRCIAPDLPGFGGSSALPASYDFSIESQIAFLDAFLAQVAPSEKITLVTHDIGAVMGLAWATRYPERVAHLLVMNVVFHADYQWHSFAKIMATPILSWLFMAFVTRGLFVNALLKDFPQLNREQADSIFGGLTPIARSSLPRLFRAMTRPDFFRDWEKPFEVITRQVPTRVIWGKQDALIPEAYAHRIGDNLRMLEHCGHWVPLEAPAVIAEEVQAGFSR